MMTGRFKHVRAGLPALVVALAGHSLPVQAQTGDTVSRAVVQPLPPAASADLNEALMRLARDRRDVDALIAAGLASLKLDDIEAAIGFFGRAKSLSPENPRIAEGMGAAYVRSGRPIEALKFFEEAEQAGISNGSLWADRGLAYDLVGQNEAAQDAYRRALALADDGAVRQRLAISYAIGGARAPFEETLKPLLDARDFAGYRSRAFGLAVLGDADEAIEIARAVMPRDLAGRLEPYLRFMPRLTRSQQAAAANLGIYPSASRIGRDDPRIASAAGMLDTTENTAAALEPTGAALGNGGASSATPARPGEVRLARGTRIDEPPTVEAPNIERSAAADTAELAAVDLGQAEPRAVAPVVFDLRNMPGQARVAPPLVNIPAPPIMQRPAAVQAVALAEEAAANAASAPAPQSSPAEQLDLATAFADFSQPTTVAVVPGDVVDISAIKPPREKVEEAKPAPPPAPSRIWLQLGIGQNRNLLRGDWRLKYRKFDVLKDKGPYVTPLGQTNRLLAGPFASQAEARKALNALAAEGVDSFVWTSPKGQEIEDLR